MLRLPDRLFKHGKRARQRSAASKRGQLGRMRKGRIPADLAYGYRSIDGGPDGRGVRRIDPAEAETIRRIFAEYAAGKSPEAIARDLNREGVPGPSGRPRSNTTLRGRVNRGTGVLNNALYRGVIEWNRCGYLKDPKTGKRVARPNPTESWETVAVPDLRIVDDDLWARVKARQFQQREAMAEGEEAAAAGRVANDNPLNRTHGPRFLLSGLLRCGRCGGTYAIVGRDCFACSTRKQKGTCDNGVTITRGEIEARVLGGLKERLMSPELVVAFVTRFQAEARRERDQFEATRARRAKSLAEVDRKIGAILRAVEDGLYDPAIKERLVALRSERDQLERKGAVPDIPDANMLLHPSLPEAYRRRIERLERALEEPEATEARQIVRSMIDRVALTPRAEGCGLEATHYGDLAAVLQVCAGAGVHEKPSAAGPAEGRLSVVAGARNHRKLTLNCNV